MMLVDNQEGSKELLPFLDPDTALPCRIVNAQGQPIGDVAFHGNGPDGDVQIGVEVKRLADLLSSESTGRLAGTQLPRMLGSDATGHANYDFIWLLSIGRHRCGPQGYLEVRRGKFWAPYRIGSRPVPYGYLEAFLIELQVMGILHKNVYDYQEAAAWLGVLYRWFAKPWDKHKAMRKLDKSRALTLFPGLDESTKQRLRTFETLPNLGFERALTAARVFPSIVAGVTAPEQEWAKVPGIGKVIARSVVRACHDKE